MPGEVLASSYSAGAQAFLADANWKSFLTKFIAQNSGTSANADWAESNDDRTTAYNLHRLGGAGNTFSSLSLSSTTDVDWFRFFIQATGTNGDGVRISDDSSGTLRLTVEDESGKSLAGSGELSVSLAGAAAGEYFVKIYGDGKTIVPQYSFAVDAPGSSIVASDWARGNDIPGKATALGLIDSSTVFSGLTLQPGASNWFAFETPRNPSSNPGQLSISRTNGGSLTITMQDGSGRTIASKSGTGVVAIPYASGGGATYKFEVQGAAGDYQVKFQPGSGDALLTSTSGGGGTGGGSGSGGGGGTGGRRRWGHWRWGHWRWGHWRWGHWR